MPGSRSGTGGAGRKLPGSRSGTGGAGRKLRGERGPDDAREEGSRGRRGESRRILSAIALVGQLGLTVVSGALVGALAGYGLDGWLGTKPGFLVGGLLFGLAGGATGAYRLIARHLGE